MIGHKRFLQAGALFLAVLLLFCGCAAPKKEPASEPSSAPSEEPSKEPAERTLTLPYSASDALSPMKLTGALNDTLTPLFYDSLIQNDEHFAPVTSMAEKLTEQDAQLRVILKKGLKFWDGTAVTAEDVAASFRELKSAPVWKKRLEKIESVRISGKNELLFQLKDSNSCGSSLLAFPVFKKGTEQEALPVGSGPYCPDPKEKAAFSVNPHCKKGSDFLFAHVVLSDVPERSAAFYGVKTGAVDLVAASASELSRNRGSYVAHNALSFVYLGMNTTRGPLRNQTLRQALFCGIRRTDLTSGAFGGLAKNSFFPVHPSGQLYLSAFYDTASFTEAHARELMETFPEGKNHIRKVDGKEAELTLLVSRENNHMQEAARMIAENAEDLGIKIRVKNCSFADLKKQVEQGDFDLYLGEVHLSADQDLSVFFAETKLTPGTADAKDTQKSWRACRQDRAKLPAFLDDFSREVPFVPLLFLDRAVMTSRRVNWHLTPTESNLFFGMENWGRQDEKSNQN